MVPIALADVLPLATKWVEEEQKRILAGGVPLTPHQAFDAHLAGVRKPDCVRLFRVDFIPTPTDPVLRRANDRIGLVSPMTAGITFGYGIYLREDLWKDRPLLAHELVHVGQYERYGSVEAFLRDYLEECLTLGYPRGPLEQEAMTLGNKICEQSV